MIDKELAENAARVLEIAHASKPESAPAEPVEPVKLDLSPVKPSLVVDEELKIPSWLEPLARNAAAPSSTQELIDREKAKRQVEQPKVEQVAAEVSAVLEEHHVPELPLPSFIDPVLLEEEKSTRESGTKRSGKGVLLAAIAAGLLVLVGGGWWILKPQFAGVHAGPAPAPGVQSLNASGIDPHAPALPQENAQTQTNSPAQTNPAGITNTSAPANSASNSLSIVPAVSSVATPRNSQPNSNSANSGARSTASAAAGPAEVEQPKKPALGEVHLAAPKVNSSRRAQNSGEPDAGVTLTNDDPPDPGAEALNAGLVGGNNQPSAPVAPLPVGGDVKQAELISKVAPAYPSLAKTQHVSGNVLIDALIDANGKVTTMKVISGPTLLHQAAMDALKQWKYQPATLDGKAVSMHLTVTLQFRLQ